MSFLQFLNILRARWLLLVTVPVLFIALAVVITLVLPKQYTADTALVFDIKTFDPVGGALSPQLVPSYLATQIEIITSARVAREAAIALKLDEVPVIRQQWLTETGGKGNLLNWSAELLKKRLQVQPGRDSNLLTLRYTSIDPQFSAQVANAFADAYLKVALQMKVEPARQYAVWFDEQNRVLRDKLNTAQQRLSAYQREHGILAGTGQLDVESERLSELSSQLVDVQGKRADSSSRESQIAAADTLPEVLQSQLIVGLKADVARLESRRQQLLGQLGQNHPEVMRLDDEISSLKAQISSEVARIAVSLGTNTRISNQREEEIAAALEAQKQRVLQLKEHVDQIAVLQRDVDSANRAYDQVAQRLSQFNLESANQQVNVAILTRAEPPLSHASPRGKLNVIIATFLGGLLGIVAALLWELSAPRLRSSKDMQQLEGVAFLGVVGCSQSHRWWHGRQNLA